MAIYPELEQLRASPHIPNFVFEQKWEAADALREIVRARLECLGPIQAQQLANELAVEVTAVDLA